MLISCNKLKSYIENSQTIDWLKIWDLFTVRTAEVENVTEKGHDFDGVVVAQIKSCKMHPDSDHMHVLEVDAGEDELIQVVCGAPNVREGLKIAYVKVGGHIGDIEIQNRKLRGVMSSGMCCSKRELSIGEEHDGILELPSDAPIGMDIKKYLPEINDIIVEIDNKSLTNRPDLWGHYGIAREIAAITHNKLKPLELSNIENNKEDLDIKIQDSSVCYRYSGLKLANVTNKETPIDMQIFLNYVGYKSNGLIVDLTNYLMIELGQPMHAFDARIVKNIEVGFASSDEEFTTLDGITRKLDNSCLMIKNGDEYFALAGIMGGLDSEIEESTTSLFLESATFNAACVRKTASNLGMRTEASARYEKSLDPNMTTQAIQRYVYLLKKENPNLEIMSNLTDIYPNVLTTKKINLSKKLLTKYLNAHISDEEIKENLESLGFGVGADNEDYLITVPTFRCSKDISIAQDIIEEIARMHGLENFQPKPLKLNVTVNDKDKVFDEEYEVKYILATKYDMHEVHSYLWYDTKLLKLLEVPKDGVKILGKSENNILRDDMSLSLLNIVERNFKNFAAFSIFEIGTIIQNNQNKRALSIILADEEQNLSNSYNKAKEIIKYIFKTLKNKNVSLTKMSNAKDYYDENLSKNIIVESDVIGTLNVLKKSLTNKLAKKKCLVCIDIDFDKYVSLTKEAIYEKKISKYPVVELDYSIIASNQEKYADLKEVLDAFKSNLILGYKLVDIYENKYTIKYTIGSQEKTLGQKDLKNFQERFIVHIKENGYDIKE